MSIDIQYLNIIEKKLLKQVLLFLSDTDRDYFLLKRNIFFYEITAK